MRGVFLQMASQVGGWNFGGVLDQLDQADFFSLVLPFLLIFAMVYAILTQIKIFKENKGASVIIALAVGLLSIQLGFVSSFFQVIFPNLGIALSIMLCALVLAGAFISGDDSKFKWVFFGLGAFVFLITLFVSLSSWQFYGSYAWTGWWGDYGGLIMFLLILIGVVVAVSRSTKHS